MEKENDEPLVYDGPYKDNIADGWVHVIYNNGVFTGEFRNGRPSNGAMFFKNNIIFSGKFDENGQFSEGDITSYGGRIIECVWKNYQDYIFAGFLVDKNDLFSGYRVIFRNGDVFNGEFDGDKPSKGEIIYSSGDYFDGDFRDGMP
ncbi:MAG: hypothetical protein LBP39_00280, partial [Rickettsiales bacterium]|nr:hypothetical protein [Rickettsiales bacterium]